jgi:mannose-1-phosphate guanylyltransferase
MTLFHSRTLCCCLIYVIFVYTIQCENKDSLYGLLSSDSEEFFCRSLPANYVRLDQDILSPLAGKKQLYIYETMDFWEQIKTPG